MDKANIHTCSTRREINPAWFTGKTRMRDVGGALGMAGHDVYHVYFEHGSKTMLHRHDGNQILIATKGRGILETFKKAGRPKKDGFAMRRIGRTPLKEGDVAYIPSGTLHVHGSASTGETFAHIAINVISPRKSTGFKTVWYESNLADTAGRIIK